MEKLVIAMSIIGLMAVAPLASVFVAYGGFTNACPQKFTQVGVSHTTGNIDRNGDEYICTMTTPSGRVILIDNNVQQKDY